MTQGTGSKWKKWKMVEYEFPGMRGGTNSAAPQATKLARQLISPPYPAGIYYGKCVLSESKETCRRNNCKFYHDAGDHVTGIIPSAAKCKAAQGE